ncbi:MAG: hypothetical protein RL664_1248 [Bacteroidota bacterium]
MRLALLFSLLILSVGMIGQPNQKKLESSYDLGIGNHFGLRQIESGFNVNSLTLSNYTFGWNNYFTNYKFGGRLEVAFDKMKNNTNSSPFETNYYRATYYLNASLKNIVGWGKSNKPILEKKSFLSAFDIDLAAGIGYSAMTSKGITVSDSPFIKKADDMLNMSFRIAPSLEIADGLKLFASYTRINHSSQSKSFDFTRSIDNTAFKGAFRTLNVGIRYTPSSTRKYSRALKDSQKNLHFITSVDASFGNHFGGSTSETKTKFKSSGINHFNLGAMHKYPNSRLSGRFDLGFDVFTEQNGEPEFKTKYFRTTYQVIADLGALNSEQGETKKFNIALGMGLGFSTMYNAKSKENFYDRFLNGDDMYSLVFSFMPSYKISESLSLVSTLSLVSNSLQTMSWDLKYPQTNSAFNGRLMNLSLGLRYHLGDRRWNDYAEIGNKIKTAVSADVAIGNHFSGRAQSVNQNLNPAVGKHMAVGLEHRYHKPVYFGRFELARDIFEATSEQKVKYFRANYYLMSSVKNQLKQKDTYEEKNEKIDLQFGIGLGASMLKSKVSHDTFVTKGDDMWNLCLRIAPTYKLNDKLSAFMAYTFVSHSLQSMYYNWSQSITKTMFNGHLMNASLGLSYTLKSSKPRAVLRVDPIVENIVLSETKTETVVESTPEPTVEPAPEPVVEPTPEPVVEPTPTPAVEPVKPIVEEKDLTTFGSISDYPVNSSDVPETQKKVLRELAAQLNENKFLSVVLSGHADNSGSPEYNQVLSRKRAASIKAYLITQGVSPERISIEYFGSTKPVSTNETAEGRKKNRRVDIEIMKN